MKYRSMMGPLAVLLLAGCAASHQKMVKIDSLPSDALISVHDTAPGKALGVRKVAGATPLAKSLEFGSQKTLWVEAEKRGYAPQVRQIDPGAGEVHFALERIRDSKGQEIGEYAFPKINRVLLALPEVEVVERGFAGEKVSPEATALARQAVAASAGRLFSGRNMKLPPSAPANRIQGISKPCGGKCVLPSNCSIPSA